MRLAVFRPAIELADVFRRYGASFREALAERLPLFVRRVMSAIQICRTAALGGHLDRCTACGHQAISYNSCRNRHCPKCQGASQQKWLSAREQELLPVPYFHVVFTLPGSLADIAFQNKRLVYGLLFSTTATTLLTIARDPKRLGADIGFFAVLHTWGQNLLHHPHLHCVIPSGGLSPDRTRWVACRPRFFLPVRVLSRLFRKLFLKGLSNAFDEGALRLDGPLSALADPTAFAAHLQKAGAVEWVVYAKPPFGGPEKVLRYLGRYTHRVALTNRRILAIDDGFVRFLWRDYRRGNRQREMTLAAHEFIRRFLIHVLPPRFRKIRHFGLFANCHRKKNIALCRQRIQQCPSSKSVSLAPASSSTPTPCCSACGSASLVRIELAMLTPRGLDSS